MEKREFRERRRKSGIRDTKLLVIATEGDQTEKAYFYGLIELLRNTRTHIEILEREDPTLSSPNHVIRELDEFKEKYVLQEKDELWMLIDFDRWGEAKLGEIAAECFQKKYFLALSRPCFEFWLLLHFLSIEECSEEERQQLLENKKQGHRSRLEGKIIEFVKSYNKSNLDTDDFLPLTEKAYQRALHSDSRPSDRWPQGLGTRVYRLLASVLGDPLDFSRLQEGKRPSL